MAFAKKSLSLAVLVSVGVFAACADGGNDDGLPPAPPPGTNQAAQGVALPALKPGGQLATPLAARGNAAARTTLAPVEQEVVVQLRSQPGRRIDGQRLLSARLDRAARQIRTPRKPANLAGVARPELFTVEVDKASGRTVDDVIRDLKQMPEVEFAEPNYRYETSLTPNDPLYGSQLQFEPIRAPQAWDVTTGSSSVVVAVIDTGVELTHPDLAANIWRNPGEIAGDGLDNDQNGFVDDVTGYDFVSATTDVASGEDPGPPDNDPADFQGHGTHVAGIVGAVGNDGNGVTGVAWTVKLMPLRAGYLHSSGVGTLLLSDIANALHYAADKGAHVVNMSFGGSQPSQILADALRYAADRGVLLIAAAGNTGTSVPQFPASYDRVLSVAATEGNALALFSSFGTWVDIAAPGVNVLSTYLGGSTAFLSGTSMASPVVAGTAALVRASHPTWTAQQIAEKLTSTASATASGWKKPFGAGLTDAGAAVTAPAALATFDTVGVQFEELSGDGDGNPEAGETGRLYATIKNYGPAGSAIVSLQTTEPGVTVSGSPATLQAFGPTRLATASFGFTLPSNLPVNRSVTFNVTVTSGSRSFTDAVALDPVRWAPPRILAERFSWNQIITGLPNGSVAVVAELEGVGGTFTTIGGIVKSPTGQWPALTQLSGPTDAVRPNLRVAPDGGLDVTFERSVGQFNYQIFYRRYTASSASWGPEEQVTTNATLHLESFDHVRTNHAVARDSTGRLHVAWIDSAGLPRTLRYTTRSSSSAWSAPVTLTTFPETDLLEAKLEMFVLPDGSRRLIVQRYAPGSIGFNLYREVVLSGTGTTWQAPVTGVGFFDTFPPFLQGSNVFRIAKRAAATDPLELLRWTGSTWVTDRVIGPNPTGTRQVMAPIAFATMNTNNQFGVIGQEESHFDPYDYSSGLAGSLSAVRATSRQQLMTQFPKLFVTATGTPHAVFGQQASNAAGVMTLGQVVYQSSVADAGMVLASKPTVSANVTSSALSASWTVTNPSQVSKYLYAAGTAPGSDDLAPWAQTTATSVGVTLSERPPVSGETYYVSVRPISTTGHAGALGFSAGVTLTQCTPETDTAFCARLAKNCGAVSGTDNCGQARTVSSCGSCVSPQTCGGGGTPNVCGGGGGSTACSNLCSNPTPFTGPGYSSGNLGTAATCHQTAANLTGGNCGNFASGRTFRVNNVQVTCSGGNITLPPKLNGGYCFQASAGNHPWAYFTTW